MKNLYLANAIFVVWPESTPGLPSSLRPKKCHKTYRQRVLILGGPYTNPGERVATHEKRLVGPIVPVFQTAQSPFNHLVFAGKRNFFKVLRHACSGCESVAILEPFQPGSKRPFAGGLKMHCGGNAVPFTQGGNGSRRIPVLRIIKIDVRIQFVRGRQ